MPMLLEGDPHLLPILPSSPGGDFAAREPHMLEMLSYTPTGDPLYHYNPTPHR
jgi:hypothetical protein